MLHTFCGGGVAFAIAADLSADGIIFDSANQTRNKNNKIKKIYTFLISKQTNKINKK